MKSIENMTIQELKELIEVCEIRINVIECNYDSKNYTTDRKNRKKRLRAIEKIVIGSGAVILIFYLGAIYGFNTAMAMILSK